MNIATLFVFFENVSISRPIVSLYKMKTAKVIINVFKIKYPKEYKKYVASKGSICLDGISLTINEVFDDFFSVNIIPHTEENTSWSKISKGDSINVEFDVLARYVASQLEDRK